MLYQSNFTTDVSAYTYTAGVDFMCGVAFMGKSSNTHILLASVKKQQMPASI